MKIKTVAVLGANGTMGYNISGIFASFGNAKVYMISRNIEKSKEAKDRAYLSVKAESVKRNLECVDYSQIERVLPEADLIFEACSENWEVKKSIHEKIAKVVENYPEKVICSGTSGLSITNIAECYSDENKSKVIGMHFFNPPYTMSLCEIIPTKYTNRKTLEEIKHYAKTVLYRTVVQVKDEPAFLGNRIGFQFINETLQLAEKYKYNGGIDYIDAIFGPYTGRAMPPLRTSDFVGLDVHKAIVENIYLHEIDNQKNTFKLPDFINGLIEQGALGKKVGTGLYKTIQTFDGKKEYQVYDIESKSYRKIIRYSFPFVEEMISFLREGNYKLALNVLKTNYSPEAMLCCETLLHYILYALQTSVSISNDVHAADDVMATGFNWCPPLAWIDALGGKQEFILLCNERLTDKYMSNDFEEVFDQIEPSKYDFRKYIRARK